MVQSQPTEVNPTQEQNQDRQFPLPPQFTQSLQDRLRSDSFSIMRYGMDITDNRTLQNHVFQMIDGELGQTPEGKDLLSQPVMGEIDKREQAGQITAAEATAIRRRTQAILVLTPLLDTAQFQEPQIQTRLRSLIMMLAKEPVNAYGTYYPQNLEPLSNETFISLTRKVLAINIRNKISPNIKPVDYPELSDNNQAMRLALSLRTQEAQLIQTTFLNEGYLKSSAKRLMGKMDVFNYSGVKGDPAEDARMFLMAAREPVSLDLLLDFMGIDTKTVNPEITSAIKSVIAGHETPPGSGKYKVPNPWDRIPPQYRK